jgi:hypothetical protein
VYLKKGKIQIIDNQNIVYMKKNILTIAAIIALAFGVSKTVNAAPKTNAVVVTTLSNISRISKIEIHGNVEVYVSTGANDQVKVYNKYYAETALVQSQNGVLRITSYTNQKLVVWVTANDLRNITAYDNAEVKSFGNLSSIDLEVNLHNTASASLNMDAYHAKINVDDHAKLNLEGNADDCSLTYSRSSTVNGLNFASTNLVKTAMFDNTKKADTEELTIL